MDMSKADMSKALRRLQEPRNGEWKGMDDLDHVETRPVELQGFVHQGLRCEYVVEGDRTKIHLFEAPGYAGKWGPLVTSRMTKAAAIAGPDTKVDWVPELSSWYIDIPRAVPDGALATRRIVEAFVASASPV